MCAVCVWHCECNRCGSFSTRGPIWICSRASIKYLHSRINFFAHVRGRAIANCDNCRLDWPWICLSAARYSSVRVCGLLACNFTIARTQIASLIWFTLCPLAFVNCLGWENSSVTQFTQHCFIIKCDWRLNICVSHHYVIWWEYFWMGNLTILARFCVRLLKLVFLHSFLFFCWDLI